MGMKQTGPDDTRRRNPTPPDAIKLHHALAMNKPVETGAGRGAMGGKSYPKTPA